MLLLRRGLPSHLLRHSRPSSTFSNLESTLKARQLPVLFDYLTPQPSHLLSATLVDFLPFLSTTIPTHLPSISSPKFLPISHHLVYFPTPTKPSSLLPDGTDTLHSPGEPFTHRLWAGGHIRFPREDPHRHETLLDGKRAAIVEGIRSVRISGQPGSEKVFVGIERRVAHVQEGEEDNHVRARVWTEDEAEQGDAIIIEKRDLCFLRPGHDNINHSTDPNTAPPRRPLIPPTNPQFTHPLTPTPHLLTRYSALTYNAHAIHLDPLYTRAHYAQPALLVHGPLLLTLLVTCLSHELEKSKRVVREITYRCLAPVLVGEAIRVCGKRIPPKTAKKGKGNTDGSTEGIIGEEEEGWDVWIEKGGGGDEQCQSAASLAVRATVKTAYTGWVITNDDVLSASVALDFT